MAIILDSDVIIRGEKGTFDLLDLRRCGRPFKFWEPRMLPSGEKAVRRKIDPCPSRVSSSCRVWRSQILMASFPALATARRLLSGENATELTLIRNPPNVPT